MYVNLSSIIPAISFLLYIVFAVFGVTQRRTDRLRWPFIFYMLAMAIWSFGSFMMHSNTPLLSPLTWNRFMVAGLLGGPITLFHAMLDLSGARKKRFRILLAIGYAMYLFLLVLDIRGLIVTRAWFQGDQFHYALGEGAIVAYALSYPFVLVGVGVLLREMVRARGEQVRRKLKPPLYGAMIMLVGIAGNLYTPIGKYPVDLAAATLNAVLIFYAIYKYRLVHYSALVLRSVLYFVLVVVAGFVFYGLSLLGSHSVHDAVPAYPFLLWLLLGIVAAVIFQPLRRGAMSIMEKLYFGKRFAYHRSLRSFSSTLTSIVELGRLSQSTIDKIVGTFDLEWALMVVLDYASRNYRVSAYEGLPLGEEDLDNFSLNRDSPFVRAVSKRGGVVIPREGAANMRLRILSRNLELEPSLVLPLKFKDRLNGCVVLGPRRDKDYYDQFDLETLEILVGQASVTLENAISFERLKRQQRRLQDLNAELIVSKNKLEAFFDGITTPISIQDINYNVVIVNYAATRYFGQPFKDLVGKKCYQVYFNRNKPCPNCLAQDCLHAQIPFGTDVHHERTDMTFAIHFYPVAAPAGQETLFLEFFQDITEQKRLQAELAQSEKLASIGTLASGIAHEINNPLYGILGTAEIMLDELPEDSQLRGYVREIIEYSQGAAEVIRELTEYSRQERGEPSQVSVVEALQTALKLARRGMSFESITVEEDYGELPVLEANPTQLQQVFLNLIINAIQAMEGGGTLTVRCAQQGENAVVEVGDTGTGIARDSLEQIFTPFFTTKSPGKGSGLGLSITHRIVHNLGGRIKVVSEEGTGTTFTVMLPVTHAGKRRVRFVHARTKEQIEDVFFLQRKILVGEKGYLEETIRRREDEEAYHIVAYKGLHPVGTVSLLTPEMVNRLPIEHHFQLDGLKVRKRCVEIDRLAVLREERGSIVSLGLMTLAYLLAKAASAERIFVDVFADEAKYIQMYAKLGFQVVGEYHDPLAVKVMLLDYQTDYERKNRRMEWFVKPFMRRLFVRLDFEKPELQKIEGQIERIVSGSLPVRR